MSWERDNRHRWLRFWLWATVTGMSFTLVALVAGTMHYSLLAEHASEEMARQMELNARIRQLQMVLTALSDAETGQRGYLLTGKPAYLEPYRRAVQTMPGLLKALDGVPGSTAELDARAARIRELVAAKLAELAKSIALVDAGQREAALELVKTDVGLVQMSQVRQELDTALTALRGDRDAMVARTVAAILERRQFTNGTVAALVVCALLSGLLISLLVTSQRRHARELAQSEARHRAIVEDQQELVCLTRVGGILTFVNPAFARAFRAQAQDLVGRSLCEFVHPDDLPQVTELIQRVIRTGEPGHGENRIKTGDDSTTWIAWSNAIQRGADGEVLIHSVGRDITERKQAEDALRASQEFLARTGRVAGIGGWEVDLRTDRVLWSEEVRRIHDVPDDFVPTRQNAVEFYEPEHRAQIAEASRAGFEDGTPFDLELPMITGRGKRIWVRSAGEVERDAAGVPVRIVGALQNITERKKLEEQLAASERFLRQITDSLPVRLAYLDLERRFRFANAAQQRRIGLPLEQVLGRKRVDLMQGPQEAAVMQWYEGAFAGQTQQQVYEELIGDEPRVTQSQWIPDIGPDGQVVGVYAISIDVTEQQLAERRLRELNEILESSTDFVIQTDWQGRIRYLNPAARRALGMAGEEPVEHRSYTEFFTPDILARYADEIMPAVRERGVWVGETSVLLLGGQVTPINHMVIAHRDGSDRVSRYSSVMRDISERVAARKTLRQQAATMGAIVDSVPAMVAVFDVDLRYMVVNRAFERWRGRHRDEVIGRGIAELFGDHEYERSLPWAQRALAGETVSYEKSYPEAVLNQHLSVNYAPLRMEDGSVIGLVAVAQDITLQRLEEKRLLTLAERDSLTGVLNRVGFNHHLAGRGDGSAGATTALLYIDLDHFKPVNDTHGHAVGDELLRQFAERLRSAVRPTDAVARLGGDEFAVVLDEVRSITHANAVADKIVDVARLPFQIGDQQVQISACVGVAHGLEPETGWQGLVDRADAAVYRAKGAGRNRRS